jgi:hypothetical protein
MMLVLMVRQVIMIEHVRVYQFIMQQQLNHVNTKMKNISIDDHLLILQTIDDMIISKLCVRVVYIEEDGLTNDCGNMNQIHISPKLKLSKH